VEFTLSGSEGLRAGLPPTATYGSEFARIASKVRASSSNMMPSAAHQSASVPVIIASIVLSGPPARRS
jgi:hypothetical protein